MPEKNIKNIPPRQRSGTAGVGQTGKRKVILSDRVRQYESSPYRGRGSKNLEKLSKERLSKEFTSDEMRELKSKQERDRVIQNKGTQQSTAKLMSKTGVKNDKLDKLGAKTESNMSKIKNLTRKQGDENTKQNRLKYELQKKKS